MIGRTVNQYEILSKLGEGGMGVVYRAHDKKLDRFVALKFLPRELSSDPAVRKRFVQEARASSALDHPNISTVHEIGETPEGGLFIVMPCYEGESLSERLERGSLGVAEALKIAVEIARGLARAHDQGVIHRDIKPGNVMLVPDGQARIMDFGLAVISGASRLTQDGTMLGTAAYMSPEQTQGGNIDNRTDVWALGAVLYEMLSGKSPFDADHHLAIMYSIMNEEPEPLSNAGNEVPFEVEQIVSKAMEKDPEKRFQTADDMIDALEELQETLDLLPKRGEFRKRIIRQRRRLVMTAVYSVIAASLVAVAVWYWWPGRAEAIDSIAVLPIVNLTGDPEQEYLSDGITAELTNELSHVSAIRVISHRTASRYKESDKPLSEIALELKVDAVVEGTIKQSGNKVDLTVQLIKADPEDQLWAENFVRSIGDLLDLYSELTHTIAGTIGAKITPDEEARLTVSNKVADDVYREFLLGRHFREQQLFGGSITKQTRDNALSHFNRAIDLDSTYAPARAGAAWVIAWHYRWWYDDERESFLTRARAEADRALDLDPDLPEVHLALAEILIQDLDFDGARQEYQKVFELDRSASTISYYAGNFLTWTGDFREAIALASEAVDLEPISEWTHHNLAWVLFVARRYEESTAKCEEIKELFPRYNDFIISMNYEAQGRYDEVAQFYRDRGYEPNFSDTTSWRASKLKEISRDSIYTVEQYHQAYEVARSYAALGYIDASIKWLELASEDYPVDLAQINSDAQFDILRLDPRFQALMKRMGIPSGDLAALEKP